jgi:SAM-dependent methyltransferase/tetratricopeptide (TPR) repeat protein
MDRPDLEPADAAGLARLGTVRRLEGRYAESAELYRRALALDPEPIDAWLGLASLLCLHGNAAAAAQRLGELLAKHPDSVPLRATLGDVRCDLGQYRAALECYEHVLDGHPEHPGCRLGLAYCLSRRPALALRLRSPQHLLDTLTAEEVDPQLLAEGACVLLRASTSLLEDPLLLSVLREAVLTDLTVERALTAARRDLCLVPPRETPELAQALAEQCRLNQSAWHITAEEEAHLVSAPAWVRAMYEPEEVAPELVERARRIPSLTPVSAGTSAAVRDHYEANPYPRWRRLSRGAPVDLDQYLRLLTGGEWEPPDFLRRPRLLVAGCGTGQELLGAACAWRPATVTGFDLSRTSLAYAQQMAERLGVEVELYHADLLRLDGWERRFDAIVCTGVLHHLDDPLAGWRILLRLLHPGGVMLVGLYSETARRGIAAAQVEVRRMRVRPTPAGIRAARARLAGLREDHPARGCAALRDFFYLSGCRDMLFHVQEHRFTIPGIGAALDELGADFLAFETDGRVRQLSRTLFGPGADLASWDAFEQLYPDTYLGMYQFWCHKREEDP